METKQTAVEWLEKQIKDHALIKPALIEGFEILLVEAKQMEKEQIKDAFDKGYSYYLFNGGGEQYYSVTYGKQDIS
jgi:hypothetical protein